MDNKYRLTPVQRSLVNQRNKATTELLSLRKQIAEIEIIIDDVMPDERTPAEDAILSVIQNK